MSEKFNGVRALWDGQRSRLRSGREVIAPRWFNAALPAQSFDGELWLGRGRFDALSAAVRRAEPIDAEWRAFRSRGSRNCRLWSSNAFPTVLRCRRAAGKC